VKVLNFTKPEASCGYNPLARAQSSSDIQKISSMLVQSALGGKTSDPFWNTQAVGLLAMLITLLKTQDSKHQNLHNLRHLLNNMGGNPEAVDSLFSKHANDILFSEYKAFLSYDTKVISGVVATCKAALQIFSDESVAKVTSFDNLNFMDFRDKPVALFIQNSVADQRYYSTLTSIFFEQFFSFILSRFQGKQEKDIFFLIDEASSLYLPTLPLAVANVRKHNSGILLMLQDFNQLVHNYGKYEADSIKSNCFTKMYFTGQSLETARELEQILGRLEYEDDKGNRVIRSLLTNDEIRMMDTNRALLVCGHHPPIIAKLKPYYKRMSFRNYSNIPAPELNNQIEADTIPLLPLNSH
jgi:type IV secretory pathway TraG/TraD family ATPase VirD4